MEDVTPRQVLVTLLVPGAISAVGAGSSVPTPPSPEEWAAPLLRLAAGIGS